MMSIRNLIAQIKNWYKTTSLHFWFYNRKNGIKILSEKEFNNLKSDVVILIEAES